MLPDGKGPSSVRMRGVGLLAKELALLGSFEGFEALSESINLLLLFLDCVDEDRDEIGAGDAEGFFFIVSDVDHFGDDWLDFLSDEAEFGGAFGIAFPLVAGRAELEDFVEAVFEVFGVGFPPGVRSMTDRKSLFQPLPSP